MTDTELRAMAAEAIHGWILTPTGENAPAAMGIPACMETHTVTYVNVDKNDIWTKSRAPV